jgi:hypothetical protein
MVQWANVAYFPWNPVALAMKTGELEIVLRVSIVTALAMSPSQVATNPLSLKADTSRHEVNLWSSKSKQRIVNESSQYLS